MKKIFTFIMLIAALSFKAQADNVEKIEEFHSFSGLSVGDSFNVTLREGRRYQVIIKVDKRLSDYCSINLKNGEVSIVYDSKRVPKEVKQQFRKDNMPKFDAVVTLPIENSLSSITLKDNAILTANQALSLHGNCKIEVTDNAQIKTFKLACDDLTMLTKRKSSVEANLKCKHFNLSTGNSSSANIKVESEKAELEVDGSAKMNLNCTFNELIATYSNFSKSEIKGTATQLKLFGKGGAEFKAEGCIADEVTATLNGTTTSVSPKTTLTLDLSNNAKLSYTNDPRIVIKRVSVSSITRISTVQ